MDGAVIPAPADCTTSGRADTTETTTTTTTTTTMRGLPMTREENKQLLRATPSGKMLRAASLGTIHRVDEVWYGDPAAAVDEGDEDPSTPEHDAPRAAERDHYDDDAGLLRPIHVRRRFHSSDVVLRGAPGGAFHARGIDSPTMALRQWIASGGAAACNDVSPAQLLHHRQRRRAQSTDLTMKAARSGGRNEFGMRRSFDRPSHHAGFTHNAIAEEILHDEADCGEPDDHDEGDEDDNTDSESEGAHRGGGAMRSRRAASEDSMGSSASESSFYLNPAARSYESVPHEDPPSVEKLKNLQKLYQEGFITVTEYKDRRLQLVDELTVSDKTINRTTDLIQTSMPVVHRDPPDFTVLRERDAIKHVFDSEKRKWTSCRIKVKIDPQPFARGGLRQVFHLQDLSVIPRLAPEGRPVSYVAKIAIDVNEDPDTYFRDVEMQAVASKFAQLYNSYNPPRRVEFLDAWILQLVPSSSGGDEDNLTMRGTICGVEPYIAGEYHKHNNNFGYVSELERNTPQAFSHFTYEASGRQMLIVDIQGVSDHYTDPQIHTRSGKEFGKGNLATRGFERFLESHRCNPICRYLKLPLNNPKDDDDVAYGAHNGARNDGRGTVPAQTYMSQPSVRIKRVDSELCHYYGDSKAFKKYQAKHQHQVGSDDATSAFVAALKEQRNCSSFCGVGLCTIS